MTVYLGLAGLKGRLRIREDFRKPLVLAPVGRYGAVNKLTGKRYVGNTHSNYVGSQVDRVSIDELHKKHKGKYRDSGPLCLYRLIQPTDVKGHTSIEGRKLPVGTFVTGHGSVKNGEDIRLTYDGGFYFKTTGYPVDLGSSETYRPTSFDSSDPQIDPYDLHDLGNRAYGALRPKIEKASLSQSLAEAASFRPMLKQTAKGFHELWQTISNGYAGGLLVGGRNKPGGNPWLMSPRGAADQYLNTQFGWVPFLNDLNSVISTLQNLETIVADASGNNDHWIGRRFREDIIESTNTTNFQLGGSIHHCDPPLGFNMVMPNSCSLDVSLVQYQEVWYEGSFKRYRPEFDPSTTRLHPALKAFEQASAVLGLRVNPTTVYRVVPYSWLADYFASVTPAIQRLEDAITGEMMCRRFHIMRKTFRRYEYRVKFSTYDGQAHDITWYKEASVKRRVNAQNAFGFSTSPTGLSAFQYSILAALGSSKFL